MITTTPARKWFTAMWISFACAILTLVLDQLFHPEPFIELFDMICVPVAGISMVACLFYWIARGQSVYDDLWPPKSLQPWSSKPRVVLCCSSRVAELIVKTTEDYETLAKDRPTRHIRVCRRFLPWAHSV
jgi:hypothetical protein